MKNNIENENLKNLCPRLVDYVVLVGCKSPNRTHLWNSQPELLRRYPMPNHKDFPLPIDVVYFCQPEGCINTIGMSNAQVKKDFPDSIRPNLPTREPTSFVFTLTDKDTGKCRYGVCLNFLRPIHRRRINYSNGQGTYSSDNGSKKSYTNQLILKNEVLDSNASTSTSSAEINRLNFVKKRPLRTHSLTSICIISHHPFFSKFRNCLTLLYLMIQKLHEHYKAQLGSSETIWSILCGFHPNAINVNLGESIRQIDVWVLRLLSTPVPLPGLTCVSIKTMPGEEIVFALPDKSRLSLIDFSLHLPMELLGVEQCFKVFTALLLEQKILLTSSDFNKLTISVLALTSLLYPLQYMFPVIPLLPVSLPDAEQLLMAPTPFIIGVPSTFFIVKNHFRLPSDICLVNLDTKSICFESLHSLPPFPQPEGKELLTHFKQALENLTPVPPISNLDSIMKDSALVEKITNRGDPDLNLTGFNPLIQANDEDSINVATRIAMVLFFNSANVLGRFTDHTRTLRLYPRPVVAFQYEAFMRSRPEPSLFTEMLAKTQAVEFLAEWTLIPDNYAYRIIQNGTYDAQAIGDKIKWFGQKLTPLNFHLWLENEEDSRIRQSLTYIYSHPITSDCQRLAPIGKQFNDVFSLNEINKSNEKDSQNRKESGYIRSEEPTDESGEDEEFEQSTTASIYSLQSENLISSDCQPEKVANTVFSSSQQCTSSSAVTSAAEGPRECSLSPKLRTKPRSLTSSSGRGESISSSSSTGVRTKSFSSSAEPIPTIPGSCISLVLNTTNTSQQNSSAAANYLAACNARCHCSQASNELNCLNSSTDLLSSRNNNSVFKDPCPLFMQMPNLMSSPKIDDRPFSVPCHLAVHLKIPLELVFAVPSLAGGSNNSVARITPSPSKSQLPRPESQLIFQESQGQNNSGGNSSTYDSDTTLQNSLSKLSLSTRMRLLKREKEMASHSYQQHLGPFTPSIYRHFGMQDIMSSNNSSTSQETNLSTLKSLEAKISSSQIDISSSNSSNRSASISILQRKNNEVSSDSPSHIERIANSQLSNLSLQLNSAPIKRRANSRTRSSVSNCVGRNFNASHSRKTNRYGSTSTGILSIRSSSSTDSRRNSKKVNNFSQELTTKTDSDLSFLDEVIKGIKNGEKPSFFSHKRIQKLLEQEQFRNFVMAQLNFNLDQPTQANATTIHDFRISDWAEYLALNWILEQLLNALQTSFEHVKEARDKKSNMSPGWFPKLRLMKTELVPGNLQNVASGMPTSMWRTSKTQNINSGGFASSFMLLETAHTHYFLHGNSSLTDPDLNLRNKKSLPSSEMPNFKLTGILPNITTNLEEPTVTNEMISTASEIWHYTSSSSREWLKYMKFQKTEDGSMNNLISISESESKDAFSNTSIHEENSVHPIADFDLSSINVKIKSSFNTSSTFLKSWWNSWTTAQMNEDLNNNDNVSTSKTVKRNEYSKGISEDCEDVFSVDLGLQPVNPTENPVITKKFWSDNRFSEDSSPSPKPKLINKTQSAEKNVANSNTNGGTGSSSTATSNSRGSSTTSTVLFNGQPFQANAKNTSSYSQPTATSELTGSEESLLKRGLLPAGDLNPSFEEKRMSSIEDRSDTDSISKIQENLPPRKSKISRGYRYCNGRLVRTDPILGPIEIIQLNMDAMIFEASDGIQIFKNPMRTDEGSTSNSSIASVYEDPGKKFLRGASTTTVESNESGGGGPSFGTLRLFMRNADNVSTSSSLGNLDKLSRSSSSNCDRTYLFQDIITNSSGRSSLWNDMQFWEDAFVDAVAQERDILGMDLEPKQLLDRYFGHTQLERKRLELDEDRILSCLMHNMVAFMIMTGVPKDRIRKKLRRLIAKSHTGLHYSQEINLLLDSLDYLDGNDIDLKMIPSRTKMRQQFKVYRGIDNRGEVFFLEIRDDCLFLRRPNSAIVDRWWYDCLISMIYRKRTQIICLSRRCNGRSELTMFYSEQCMELYEKIKETMEHASARLHRVPLVNVRILSPLYEDQQLLFKLPESFYNEFSGCELGSELNVIDMSNNLHGTLKVCTEGFRFQFGSQKTNVDLIHIKRCFMRSREIFVMESLDPINKRVTMRSYKTDFAPIILNQWQRMISVALVKNPDRLTYSSNQSTPRRSSHSPLGQTRSRSMSHQFVIDSPEKFW